MLEALREEVYRANLLLVKHGLVIFTWGNVSGIDRERGLVVIKPSGVPYEELSPDNMVIVDMEGRVVEGDLRPSTDTPTHIELYKAFPTIGGVTHTHSTYATAYAQACRPIPLVHSHGPFVWAKTPTRSAELAATLEEVARIAYLTEQLGGQNHIDGALLDKHFLRKHGSGAYYGQKSE